MGERLMMQDNSIEDKMWPYVFCTNCKCLSPLQLDAITDKPECMVCGYVIVSSKGGRRVLLTKEEARLRNLPMVK
jgi:ribosomal protein S27E